MIVVIQCAGSKRQGAGKLLTKEGRQVSFVAEPKLAPVSGEVYARPDDHADNGETWRSQLLRYNKEQLDNPIGLLPAYRLYTPSIYERLANRFGVERLYILSAGWGLIAASFLTPYYDITFSAAADQYKRRKKLDFSYLDFQMLSNVTEPVTFFGGKDYLPLFCRLTESISTPRFAFYCSSERPDEKGVSFIPFHTARRTNWHYECADAFLEDRLTLPPAI